MEKRVLYYYRLYKTTADDISHKMAYGPSVPKEERKMGKPI